MPVDGEHPVEEALARAVEASCGARPACALSASARTWSGVVVSEMTIETTMAVESTTANSRNRRPTMPPIIRMGMNTAISDMLMEKTVNPISFAPCSEAANGSMPASRWRVMFSITTMASSTTKPVATVSAISERLSSV